MLLTRMLSERSGTPGRRQQMPRTTRSMATPASEARDRASMISGSASAFSLAQIAAGRPARACAAYAPISSKSVARKPCGA